MRRCAYCGRENGEGAEYCLECGTTIPQAPAAATEGQAVAVTDAPAAVVRDTVSERAWSARDAWKCLGMLVVFELLVALVRGAVGVSFPSFAAWSHSGAGHLAASTIYFSVDVLVVLYFARTESFDSFLKAFGLGAPPSAYVWFAVVVTLAIRVSSHLLIAGGLAKGATSTSLWGFAHTIGPERYLYLAPALMAPFAEELYMRGFFYRAFRSSYSAGVSVLLIVALTALTHWSQYHRSLVAVAAISGLTVLQCFLRERTGNLWDCIICHFVFNASGAFAALLAR